MEISNTVATMKKLLFLFILMLSPMLASAQTVSDVQNSGCLNETRGEDSQRVPTIVLTKEGSVLSVQLLNYQSDCCTEDFNVTSNISGGSDGEPCSIAISVVPVSKECDCICPYNVSFTVRDLESNNFYLDCWWYKGQVELTEEEPLVLEDIYEDVTIDGINFTLRKAFHQAMLTKSKWEGEVRIPSELSYEGQTYSVTSIYNGAFSDNTTLTKIYIPRSIKSMDFSEKSGFNWNPFYRCSALESIEVEDGNPVLCTVDGVLFNKEKTRLYCYPAADSRSSYTVPEGITWIDGFAFAYNHHLVSISLPDDVTSLGASAFYDCTNLEEVNLPSGLKTLAGNLFENCQHLKSITIPEGVTHLGGKLFTGCASLTSVTMPKSITTTDHSVFENCKSLKYVTLSPNLDQINHNMFINCSSLTEIQIPKSVTSVRVNAFKGCEALKTLDLPESVTNLGDYVFSGCKFESLYIRGVIDFRRTDHYWLFDGMSTQTKVYVQPSQVNQFKKVFKGTVLPLSDRIEDDYRPFVEEGKVWNIATINPVDPSEAKDGYYDILGRRGRVWNRKSYVIEGDTVIGGVTYKKLLSDGKFVCGMREEEGRVYRRGWDRDPDTEALVYDFNAQPGDVFMSTDGFGKIQVKHVREVNINGQNRRCLEMHHYDVDEKGEGYNGGFADYWIEGIGCTGDMHNPFWWDVIGNYPLLLSCYDGDECIFNIEDFNAQISTKPVDDIAYRPFVEEGKVWKVGNTQTILDNSVQVVDYYYFAGDTIIDGKICKQMMCQRFVNPNHPYYEYFPKSPSKVGAWYEENKKIYFYDETRQSTRIMYDFSLAANDTLQFLTDWSSPFIIGPKQTGGIDGFKGVYRDIRMCGEEGQSYHDTFWLEGVGCIRGPISNPCDPILGDPKPEFLMSCTVGDEIIYLNDEVEDGASPEGTGARKKRFDFTHTIKIQPKVRKRSEELLLYGEYNDLQLGINLDPLDDDYLVSITDESGKAVYEKSVNAGSIVALNIDISAYTKGRYTVTVENSQESFTGQFETQATGIEAIRNNKEEKGIHIYNLQGQRLSSLQKGLNIVSGRKIYVR